MNDLSFIEKWEVIDIHKLLAAIDDIGAKEEMDNMRWAYEVSNDSIFHFNISEGDEYPIIVTFLLECGYSKEDTIIFWNCY